MDTTYLPRNPVHPKTVTTCPLTALYPGMPAEMCGLPGMGVTRSCIARYIKTKFELYKSEIRLGSVLFQLAQLYAASAVI